MSAFTTPLKVSPIGGGRWKLLEEFSYYTESGGTIIVVPEGFETDFASIPRALWWLYPPYGETWGKAAVVHDFLYATQSFGPADYRGDPFTRKWADQVFLEAMKVLGAGWLKRTVMYQAVRWFAGAAWKAHAERIASEVAKRTVADILRERDS